MLTFAWLEGSRTFSIILGTILAASTFSLAYPILWWYLPKHRRRIFPESVDPRQRLQLGFGLFCMAMTFTNALCRYIPHGPLGLVHPVFFFTTIALAALLGPRVLGIVRPAVTRRAASMRVQLAATLAILVAMPLLTVVNAFWR